MRLKPANRGLLTAFFSSLLASIFCVSSYADTSNLQEVPAQFSYQNGTITITNSSGSVDLSNGLVLSFNYGANVDSFWGSPWMGWKQTAQGQSNSYQLSGCATDQVLDKNHPITVQFTPPWGNSSQPSSFKLYSTILPDPAPVQVDIKTAPGIITISNNTTAAINTQKMKLAFNYSGSINSVWGSPWIPWKITHTGNQYVLEGGIKSWDCNPSQLAPGESITIQYSGNTIDATPAPVFSAVAGKPAAYGEIQVTMPSQPTGVTTVPNVAVNSQKQPGTWGQTINFKQLPLANYTVTADSVLDKDGVGYDAIVSPNQVSLATANQVVKVNVSYQKQAVGSLKIMMPAAPAAELVKVSPTVNVTNAQTGAAVNVPTAEWGKPLVISNLPANKNYNITATNLTTSDNTTFKAQVNPSQVTVPANGEATSTITYVTDAIPIVKYGDVKTSVVAYPSTGNITLHFINQSDNSTTNKSVSSSGNTTVQLPEGSYSVTTDSVQNNGKTYYATISPATVTVSQSQAANLSVTYAVNTSKLYGGYFETWSSPWKSKGADTDLANMPAYVNVVYLSFMQPDATYSGNLQLQGTGIQTSYDGQTLKDAITALKQRNPNTKVLVAVGGATYFNWSSFNPSAIARFVNDFGLDGVDIDYEPSNPACTTNNGKVSCQSDSEFAGVIQAMRNQLPRPKMITVAAWSIGAYGEGEWANAQPMGASTGLLINPLKQVGDQIDMLNVMSYDASNAYDPKQALKAYQHYFSGKILMGVEVPPEAWGGHTYTMSEVNSLAQYVIQNNGAGMMIWSLQKRTNPASDSNPNSNMMSQAICQNFGLTDCSKNLPGY